MSEYDPDRAYDELVRRHNAEIFAFDAVGMTVLGVLLAVLGYAVAAACGWATVLYGVAFLGSIVLGVVGVYRFWFWVYLWRGEAKAV